ncbi:MAG: 1-deoxy-D-xylulose-5-phosphate synthase [Oscillospiraceae bacterium]|nr:1-deoxy-D-xylulose-5-phosphate synthase [Oscillospiraceae bacterium]
MHSHKDLVHLDEIQRKELCREIREFLVSHVSKTGGHLASNLGVVELTVAIETVFDTEKDRLVFDVGHQSYVHKLLSGRQAEFNALRQYGGISGFPKPKESNTDAFVAGHASSSVSIALGMARARTLRGENHQIIALLGDGAATGGMVYEGLNDAAVSNEPMIVILNDNAMSIDHNVGGLSRHLSSLRTKPKYLAIKRKYKNGLNRTPVGRWLYRLTSDMKERIRRMLLPTTIFESMGFEYLGPVDGHDVENLIDLLRIAKQMKRPVVLHVATEKGKGYAPAEQQPKLFHGVGKFDPETGKVEEKKSQSFSDAFGNVLCKLAQNDNRICAITAAMPHGTGLIDFKQQFPNRTFDVGIAEEHAVSMAGGLAKQGMVPVVAVYSTFLQRAYDMILQDICMLGLHVVFAVDRAGLVGEDGETHHGVFDVGFLRQAPGMTVLCPASLAELQDMMQWAVLEYTGPVAVRYPRGGDGEYTASAWNKNRKVFCHNDGDDVAIVTYGRLVQNTLSAAQLLSENGIRAKVLRLLCVAPLPTEEIAKQLSGCKHIVVVEETCTGSGISQALVWELKKYVPDCRVDSIDLGGGFVTHGSMSSLYDHCGVSGEAIATFVREVQEVENKEKAGCASC